MYIYIYIYYIVYIYIVGLCWFSWQHTWCEDYSDYALESILKGSGLFAGFSPQSSPSESRQFFTQDDAEIDEAVSRLLEAEPPEQPHRSLAPVTLATELKDLKDLKESAHPNRPSVGETGALDSLDACLHIFVHYFPDVNRQQNA